jgi:hypothetical protein
MPSQQCGRVVRIEVPLNQRELNAGNDLSQGSAMATRPSKAPSEDGGTGGAAGGQPPEVDLAGMWGEVL